LTFDDGPNPEATPRILETLRRHNVRATFFLLGRHVQQWPGLVRELAAEGHQVGNHGYTHRRLHFAGPAQSFAELREGTLAIADAAGVAPRFFRAPHGFRSPFVAAAARRLDQRVVGWSLGVWDSSLPGTDEIVRRVVNGVHPGSIVLLHDGDGYDPLGDRGQTAASVERIVLALRDRGYEFTTLPEIHR
jgi:peptidoglycan/xylan/chitin deacetylase (PgdA/CDA1 family)